MNLKKTLFTVCSVLSLQSSLSFAREGTGIISWYWKGTTRNDTAMFQAAYAASCPQGPEYKNQAVENYHVTRTDTRKPTGGARRFEAWGYAQCFFDRVNNNPPPSHGDVENPDLSGTGGPISGPSNPSSEEDDSDQLGNHGDDSDDLFN